MKKNKDSLLLYATLMAVVAAIVIGGIFPHYAIHTTILGDIFLNLLKMIVVPLVILGVMLLSLLLWSVSGRNPFTYAKGMQAALLTLSINILN